MVVGGRVGLSHAPTLSDLRSKDHAKALGADCDHCPLRGQPIVYSTRPQHPQGAAIGETPGWNEVRIGEGFVGASGRLLDGAFQRCGIDRRTLIITNAVLCQPPDRGSGADRGPDTALVRKAVPFCRERLLNELEGVESILALGATALLALFGRNTKVLRARGFIWGGAFIHPRGGKRALGSATRIYSSVHPAFVLRTPSWEPVFLTDVDRFGRRARVVQPPRALFITDPRDLHVIRNLGRVVALDVETTKEPPTVATLLCVGISDGDRTFVIAREALRHGAEAISDCLVARTMITQNGPGFDHIVLQRHGISFGRWEDTLIAHHAFAGHMPQRLDHIVSMYLDVEPWKIYAREDEKGGWDPTRLKPETLWSYNARDAQLTALTWLKMQVDLTPSRSVYETDKELAVAAREMQTIGIRIDRRRRTTLRRLLRRRIASYLGKLRRASGLKNFKPTRYSDIRKALYRILHAPVLYRTAITGVEATGASVLQTIGLMRTAGGRFCKLVLAWRGSTKELATYVEELPIERDGCVRSSWRSWGTVSGRFAAHHPNLMNLPRGSDVKSMYVARPGYVFLSFDLRQLEPRVAAYLSGDPNMIRAVESTDYHAVNAELLFGKLPGCKGDPEYDKLRYAGKRAGLAINYLADAPTLMNALIEDGIQADSRMVAAALRRIHQTYAAYFMWQDQNLEFVQQHGFLEALGGRRRHFGRTPKPTDVANFPIQGGAAFVMNTIMLKLRKLRARWAILAQVHDYLLFEVKKRELARAKREIKRIAEEPFEIRGRRVVFPVEMKTGRTWKQC